MTADARSGASLGVFLKEPVPGRAKTRLAGTIGVTRAAALYRSFVRDTLEWAGDLAGTRTVVYYTPPEARATCALLLPPALREVSLKPQPSGSLGKRLSDAFIDLLQGEDRAAIIGTDCPLLDRSTVRDAFSALEDHDAVLGPAVDGGYYLIGLRRAVPALFEGIPWSTSRVLEATLEKARAGGLTVSLLPALRDVDTVEDLAPLWKELLEAWREGLEGRCPEFPLRTFRLLSWELPRGVRSLGPRET